MITDKTVKYTKTNQMMAFVTVEDLLGTVEVVSLSDAIMRKIRQYLEIDNKVFITRESVGGRRDVPVS